MTVLCMYKGVWRGRGHCCLGGEARQLGGAAAAFHGLRKAAQQGCTHHAHASNTTFPMAKHAPEGPLEPRQRRSC